MSGGGGGGGPDPPTVGEEVSTGSFSVEDKKPHASAVAQDTEAVADVKEAEAVGDDGPTTVMNWTDFVVAYKRLSEGEINYILSRPRKPFESTYLYEDMIADSSTTKEDLEREAADHEYGEDGLSELQERVRKEYAEKGFVAVDDDAVAEMLELQQYFKETWSNKLSELGLLDIEDDMYERVE